MTRWMSKNTIKKAAEAGHIEAIRASLRHHRQIAKATKKELKEGVISRKFGLNTDYCALCQRYFARRDNGHSCHEKCPLREGPQKRDCCAEWRKVSEYWIDIYYQWDDGDIRKFRRAEKKLVTRLERELKEAKKNANK